jgi:hypothetical protein
MEFRTTFNITPSPFKITYNDPVMFIGSCFASSIGKQFESGHMPVMINPSGATYNPASVADNLEMIINKRIFIFEDLYNNNGNYLSFFHNTDFTSANGGKVLERINEKLLLAHEFLKSARFLFITFGTSRIYLKKDDGMIVSNCHKLPSGFFNTGILSVDEIVARWNKLLEKLHSLYPELKVVFTVSPVRHWKDGAHGNQVSKSILILAIEQLLGHKIQPAYFPAYELLLDDLRDYRFYDNDLLHPSSEAIEYIWDAFAASYFEKSTLNTRKEVAKITKAMQHRLLTDSEPGVSKFAATMLDMIESISSRYPSIDLTLEKEYFLSMLK